MASVPAISRHDAQSLLRQVNQLLNRQLSLVCQVNGLKSTGIKAELQKRIANRKSLVAISAPAYPTCRRVALPEQELTFFYRRSHQRRSYRQRRNTLLPNPPERLECHIKLACCVISRSTKPSPGAFFPGYTGYSPAATRIVERLHPSH